ncbi:hypothetical protein ABIB25_000367 [Nakamurella sp. UYEF19]
MPRRPASVTATPSSSALNSGFEVAVAGREDPAGGHDLDPVGAAAQDRPDHPTHLVDAVSQMRRAADVVRDHAVGGELEADAGQESVTVAAGLTDRDDADLQLRALREAGCDGITDAGVKTAGITHRGDPGVQRLPEPVQRLGDAVAVGGGQLLPAVEALGHCVHVGVDNARHQPSTGQVEVGMLRVDRQVGRDRRDQAVADSDVEGTDEVTGAVEDERLPEGEASARQGRAAAYAPTFHRARSSCHRAPPSRAAGQQAGPVR